MEGIKRGNSIQTSGRSALRHGDGIGKWMPVGTTMPSKVAFVRVTWDLSATVLFTLGTPPPYFCSIWFIILINTFSLLPSSMQIPCYDGTCGSAGGNSPAHPWQSCCKGIYPFLDVHCIPRSACVCRCCADTLLCLTFSPGNLLS